MNNGPSGAHRRMKWTTDSREQKRKEKTKSVSKKSKYKARNCKKSMSMRKEGKFRKERRELFIK